MPASESQGQATPGNRETSDYMREQALTEQGHQYRYAPQPGHGRTPLSNGMKPYRSVYIISGIGQLAGIITAIVFMSSEETATEVFGAALLIACVAMFVLSCIGCFIISIATSRCIAGLDYRLSC